MSAPDGGGEPVEHLRVSQLTSLLTFANLNLTLLFILYDKVTYNKGIHRVHKESRKHLDIALSQCCASPGRFEEVDENV